MAPYGACQSTTFQWEWILMIVYLNDIYVFHIINLGYGFHFRHQVAPPGGATEVITTFLVRTLSFEGMTCWL